MKPTEIKPIFKISSRDITFSIEYCGQNYPISILDTPNASIAWKKFQLGVEQINEVRKEHDEPEITYSPTFQAKLESAMIDVRTEFEAARSNAKSKKEEPKKSKKPKTMPCTACGGVGYLNPDGETYICAACKHQFNEQGEYIKYPWYDEPNESEWIATAGKDLYSIVSDYIKDHVIFPEPIHYHLYTLWCISTYKMKHFDTTGYMNFEAAGNEKGKTRALEIGKELSYRAVLATRPTVAFITKALTDGATIMIDQAENTFYERDYRTDVYDVWTSGYKRGICMGKLSAADKVSYDIRDTFGAKATSMQEDAKTDNPIKARTFNIKMQKGTPRRKKLDRERAKEIRKQLYWFKNQEIEFNGETILEGRIAEIIDPLIFTARMLNLEEEAIGKLMKYAFEMKYEKADESSITLPSRILVAIEGTYGVYSQGEGEKLYITSKIVYDNLKENYPELVINAKPPVTPSRIGTLISQMGFKKLKHSNQGNIYNIGDPKNLDVLEKLKKQYRPDSMEDEIEEIFDRFEDEGRDISGMRERLHNKDNVQKLIQLKDYSIMLEKSAMMAREKAEEGQEEFVVFEPDMEDQDQDPEFTKHHEKYAPKDEETD
ncbi:MAG: hypothetical protein WC623_21755 [Pedobacter sp.]|uniref:hypothetical protein n=1 Tax=Pedobacter sp. TaxID=1411316 RepID=UPI00356AB081